MVVSRCAWTRSSRLFTHATAASVIKLVLRFRGATTGVRWVYDYRNDGDVGGSLGDLRTVTVQTGQHHVNRG